MSIEVCIDEEAEFENVIVLVTDIYGYDGEDHKYVDLESGGDAYFFNGGKCLEVTWSRDEHNQIVYHGADGKQIPFGIGHTFVSVISGEVSSLVFDD